MLRYHGVDELWNIILCISDDNLANNATCLLLDLYYTRQSLHTRRTKPQLIYEHFLYEAYRRFSYLLVTAKPPPTSLTKELEQFYESLRIHGEQLTTVNFFHANEMDHELWLQKTERLLMIIEEYIHIVEGECSSTAHITSFYGIEYQIKMILGELGKTNHSYGIVTVHSNETLEMLRTCLGQFYNVPTYDVQIGIQNTNPLPRSYDHSGITIPLSYLSNNQSNNNKMNILPASLDSKYLYQVHIVPGTTIYIKIITGTYNQSIKLINNEPVHIKLNHLSLLSSISNSHSNTNNDIICMTPTNMMSGNSTIYDILYKLLYLNNKNIDKRIRNLLCLMPSDIHIHNYLDLISIRAANISTLERRQSTENCHYNPINPQQALEYVFNVNNCSYIQLLYNLEILSSKILPLSNNHNTQQSSKLFRQDFIEQSGIEFLFQLLRSINHLIDNHEYQYSLCQEMTNLILQLLQLFFCGTNHQHNGNISSLTISSINDSPLSNNFDKIRATSDFQSTIENLQFEKFVEQIKQLIFLCWAAAAGNIKLHEQTVIIKEQVKLNNYALLQQIDRNVFSGNSSKNSSSNESVSNDNVQSTVQYGICVKSESISPLDSEIAEKIIEIITFCFEKRLEFIGMYENLSYENFQVIFWTNKIFLIVSKMIYFVIPIKRSCEITILETL